MKKLIIIPIVAAMLLSLSAAAFGASIAYSPAYSAKEAATGDKVEIPLFVVVRGLTAPATLKFVDSVKNGNIPASWLSAGPDSAALDPRRPVAQSTLSITVPAHAAPGVYSGFVMSSLEGLEGGTDPGRGSYIEITVTSSNSCTEAPSLMITGVTPAEIKVPNNKDVDVTVTGEVVNAEGCADLSVSFALNDEYGEIEAGGPLTLNGNSFAAKATVSASRKGSDLDGRTYQINISAQNEIDSAGASVNVTVGHDSGKKK